MTQCLDEGHEVDENMKSMKNKKINNTEGS